MRLTDTHSSEFDIHVHEIPTIHRFQFIDYLAKWLHHILSISNAIPNVWLYEQEVTNACTHRLHAISIWIWCLMPNLIIVRNNVSLNSILSNVMMFGLPSNRINFQNSMTIGGCAIVWMRMCVCVFMRWRREGGLGTCCKHFQLKQNMLQLYWQSHECENFSRFNLHGAIWVGWVYECVFVQIGFAWTKLACSTNYNSKLYFIPFSL